MRGKAGKNFFDKWEDIQAPDLIPALFWKDLEKMDYEKLKKVVIRALSLSNTKLLVKIAEINHVVVARALSESLHENLLDSIVERDPESSIRLYRLVRWKLNERARALFRSLLSKVILRRSRVSMNLFEGNGRGRYYGRYEAGDDFEVELTIERLISSGKPIDHVSYDDVVAIKRGKRRGGLVIILDASGSMSGSKILRAATTAAIASHFVDKRELSVIGFNNKAFFIKSINDKKSIKKVVEEILDIVPLGYTNMYDALRLALEEGRRMKNPSYILLTDGEYNVGGDPYALAEKIRLNVIYLSDNRKRGSKTCKELAEAGGGRYYEVRDVRRIPHILTELLSYEY